MASPATTCHGGQATMGTLTTMTMMTTMTTVSPAHEGDGEHMVPLGGDGAAAFLEGRVCGQTTADNRKTKKE